MEDKCGTKLWNKVMDLYLEKRDAVNKIRNFFNHCQKNGFKPMLYYTGHGEIGTGNWCFNDGTLSIQEIDDMLPGECYYPTIVSDACYSGHWANFCLAKDINGFKCLAASPEYSVAIDRPSKSLRTECSLTPNMPLILLWCARSKLNMDEICSLNIHSRHVDIPQKVLLKSLHAKEDQFYY